MSASPLRVAINAQVTPAHGVGGVQSVVAALITALGRLDDGDEQYIVVGPWEDTDWLRPYLGPNQCLVRGERPAWAVDTSSGVGAVRAKAVGGVRRAKPLVRRFLEGPRSYTPAAPEWPQPPVSKGFFEGLGCHVVHFPYQYFTFCALPSVYNPHDLQHRHFPQFFATQMLVWRETVMRGACALATTVVTASEWIKQDLIRQHGTPADKIQVIPWAPPTLAEAAPDEATITAVRRRLGFDEPFAYYPAMTWEHKNHLRLLQAVALLRDRRDLRVRLVCSGQRHEPHWSRIRDELRRLDLERQVSFLGMIPAGELRSLYGLATCVVVPTLFEAASGPMFEAWLEGTPVACSNVTSLPEQAGDAALLFDPLSVDAIADALGALMSDSAVRDSLAERGTARLAAFDLERTARAYRAVYRRCAHLPLSADDELLLAWNWMRDREPPAR